MSPSKKQLNGYRKQAELDCRKLWELSRNGKIHREVICKAFDMRRQSLPNWLRRFERHQLEIPEVIPPNRGAIKRKELQTVDISGMSREPIESPFSLKVLAIRYEDDKWIAVLK